MIELAVDDVDREARGFGPHMAASKTPAGVEEASAIQEALKDRLVLENPRQDDAVPVVVWTSPNELPSQMYLLKMS